MNTEWRFELASNCWKTLLIVLTFVTGSIARADEPHRSPIALAIAPDGVTCLTANHSGGTVSLVDLSTLKVLSELAVGNGPADIAWVDPTTALVSLLHDDSVALVRRDGS